MLLQLKEVNGDENWDLREFLQKGGREKAWNNIARWTYGIRALYDGKTLDFFIPHPLEISEIHPA